MYMPSKFIIVLSSILVIGLSGNIHSDCWGWYNLNKAVPTSLDSRASFWLVFDESCNQPAVIFKGPNRNLELWHNNDEQWKLDWAGDINDHMVQLIGIYYDQSRNGLVAITSILVGYYKTMIVAYEYQAAIGWSAIEASVVASGGNGLAYDTDRKRAIIYGIMLDTGSSSDVWGTLEFDGYNFYTIQGSISFQLPSGAAGYDPLIKRVIYRIPNIQGGPTFEYDGISWTEIDTSHNFPGNEMGTLPFIPSLGGVLSKSQDNSSYFIPETWIYINHDWDTLSSFPETYSEVWEYDMTYDPIQNRIISLFYSDESRAFETWEFINSSHCRPVSKP